MSEQMVWDIIGYLGSALVLVSLLMSSIVKLRIINALGSLIFCVYAFKIHSLPTAFMNVALVGIDMYFLFKLTKSQSSFNLVPVSGDDAGVKYLLDKYSADFAEYFALEDISKSDRMYVIYDGDTLAGITAGKLEGKNLDLYVDYTTPQYRDCSVAKFLYAKLADEFDTLSYSGSNEKHIPYLSKMGYVRENGRYIKKL